MEEKHITFRLDQETIEKLTIFQELLGKESDTIVREALHRYFAQEEERLGSQGDDERWLTTFSYDEFWDGLDIG